MQTMSDLYIEIVRLLDGDDPEISELPLETLSRLLVVAQRRLYRNVRSRWNQVSFSGVTVTSNLAALPADYEAPAIVHFGRQALKPVSEEVIRDYWSTSGGSEIYFAEAGTSFTFWPAISDGTAVQGRYYARLPDLTDSNIATNQLFQNADDVFVYAALVESAQFFGAKDEMATWESKYESIVEDLNRHSQRSAYGAGRMQIRPSAAICGGRRGRTG